MPENPAPLIKTEDQWDVGRRVSLAVFSNNETAIELYECLGFTRAGYCPRDVLFEDGRYVDSVLMYKLVDPAR